MALYQKQTIVDQDVRLCNNQYRDCTLERCRLIFDASGPIVLSGCVMKDCFWLFDGAASDTLKFISSIYNTDGDGATKDLIERMFEDIRRGNVVNRSN